MTAGRRTALVDANSQRASFQYDATNHLTSTEDPLSRRTTFTYNPLAQQATRRDARGNLTTFAYDSGNRLTGKRFSDGTRHTFTYDVVGSRLTMADPTGVSTSTYDELNRVQSVTNPDAKQVQYEYDGGGRRGRMTDPDGGVFTYVYHPSGRLKTLDNPLGERTTFTWDAVGREKVTTLANGVRTSYTYDSAGQVSQLYNLKSNGDVLSSFDYEYDDVGNRTQVTEADGKVVSWRYDKLNRLTFEQKGAVETLGWLDFTLDQWKEMTLDQWLEFELNETAGASDYSITHTYDPVGNRLVKEQDGARTTYMYDAVNQLETGQTSSGVSTYTYDNSGNLEFQNAPSNHTTTHVWDIENRLTRVLLPSDVVNTMIYNADGLRVRKQDSTGIGKFIWDLQNLLVETDDSDVTQARYTLQPRLYGNVLSQHRSSTTSFYLPDALASVVGLANSLGSQTDTYIYDAYGNIVSSSGSTINPFRFRGRLGYFLDTDSAQSYVRQRNYLANLGLWISQDRMFRPEELNRYLYCFANPVNWTDASGENPYVIAAAILVSVCIEGAFVGMGIDAIAQIIQRLLNGLPFDPYRQMCAALTGCIFTFCNFVTTALLIPSPIECTFAAIGACGSCTTLLGCDAPIFCFWF